MEVVEDLEEKEPILRDRLFEELKRSRERKRNELFDSQRVKLGEVESCNINEKIISGICSRIKRRKQADVKDLFCLSNGFLQSDANIKTFIKTVGAINILVKEFIGTDAKRQLLAAECLCNLTLGDEICCEKVAQFAGNYLTMYILNLTNIRLMKICLWILQNLAASGEKPLKILISQQLVKNVLHVSNYVMFDDIKEECNVVLLNIILNCPQIQFSFQEHKQILQNLISQLKVNEPNTKLLQVLYKLLIEVNFDVEPEVAENIVGMISLSLIDMFQNNRICADIELHYLLMIRIVTTFFRQEANLIKFIQVLANSQVQISQIVNSLISIYFGLIKEILWFIGTIYRSNNEIVQNYLKFDNIAENVKISKIFIL